MKQNKILSSIHLRGIRNNTLICIFGIIFFACKGDGFKKYYDENGQLSSEEKLVNKDDSVFYSKIYDKKGRLVREGFSDKNGIGNGYWKIYFSDGTLKWKGIAKDGIPFVSDSIINNIEKQYSYLEFEGKPNYLKVNQEYKIRTYVDGVPLSYYIVTDSLFNELEANNEDYMNYSYKITPRKVGIFEIWIVFPDSSGQIITNVSKAKIFTIEVVD